MSTAVLLSVAGFASVLVAWVSYLATIPSGKVPERPILGISLTIVGSAMAVTGIVYSVREGRFPDAIVLLPAGFAVMMGSGFIALLTQRKTPIGDIKVAVGDPLLAFAAKTSEGVSFHSDSLSGKRILLKFFRGSW